MTLGHQQFPDSRDRRAIQCEFRTDALEQHQQDCAHTHDAVVFVLDRVIAREVEETARHPQSGTRQFVLAAVSHSTRTIGVGPSRQVFSCGSQS